MGKFTVLTQTLGVQSSGAVSTSVVETYSSQLQDGLKLGKSEKMDKYDEIVGMYNKTLLAGVVTPVIDKVSFQRSSAHRRKHLLSLDVRLLLIHTQMTER